MKKIKRLMAFLLVAVTLLGLFYLPETAAHASIIDAALSAADNAVLAAKMESFIKDSRWKSGISWGDNQKPKLSTWSSVGCCAYAADFAAYVYGSTSKAWTASGFTKYTNLNEIRAGDIIHTSNHWFVVLSRNGNTLRTAEGNFDDKTRVCSDGWGIKSGKLYNLKANSAATFEYGYHYNTTASGSSDTTLSSSQIFYNIDLSVAVLNSRINQQVANDCAVVSMATVESYLYRATSAADKKTVYNALISKNGDNDYAYWGNCGYVSHSSINWTTVYDNLSRGYPVIVHRPASGSNSQHWAVVAGYQGSTTKLEKDKFIIVDVYRSGSKDIYTSGAWRGKVSIDRMVTRKNGIAITSLSGVRMAINHPALVHPYGNGHGVFGYVTSNENLTSVQVTVMNAATGASVFNKVLTPNAKSYLLFNLDSSMTFAKWAKGKYIYRVTAHTASNSASYQYAFEINSGWPVTQAQQSYVFSYNANGGNGAPGNQTVVTNGTLRVSATIPTRAGYTFLGWCAQRNGDQTWYCSGSGWKTAEQIAASGLQKKVYKTNEEYTINNSWLSGCTDTPGFTFYAIWEKGCANEAHSYTSKVTTAATCSKDGVRTYTCSNCGKSYTETIKATGFHSYTSKVTTAATCVKSGVKTFTCTQCNGSYTENIAATGAHNYISGMCTYCGKAENTVTGIVNLDGVLCYLKDGIVSTETNGLIYDSGIWYYVKAGKVAVSYTGLCSRNGIWYYVKNGKLDWSYTGLCQYNGTWYYVQSGKLNWGYTGLCQYNGTWYYVQSGKLNWNYTGLCKYNGTWYYVRSGKLDWSYTGLCQYNGTWYYVQSGKLNWNYTGLCKYNATWYYIRSGKLDWGYTGLCKYNVTWYYVQSGKLNWNYSGTVRYNGKLYTVKNGVVK